MVTPQPTRQATSKGIAGSTLTTDVWCTTTYGANVPSSDIGTTSWPLAVTRKDPSHTDAPDSRPMPRSHRLRNPTWHGVHLPHDGMNDMTT